MKKDTEVSATRSAQFSQTENTPSVLLQTPVPRMDVVLMKKKKLGSAIQNARNTTRALDLFAGAPVVTSAAQNSQIRVSPATGGGLQKLARSQVTGVG